MKYTALVRQTVLNYLFAKKRLHYKILIALLKLLFILLFIKLLINMIATIVGNAFVLNLKRQKQK